MAKIICAHPGTGRRDLAHALRNGRGLVYLFMDTVPKLHEFLAEVGDRCTVITPASPAVMDTLIELDLEFDLVYPAISISDKELQVAMAHEYLTLGNIIQAMEMRERVFNLLQSITYPKCNHIVLGAGQTLVDTHGSSNHEQQSN